MGDPVPRIASNDYRLHGAGNILLTVTNLGVLGSFPGSGVPWSNEPSAQWPRNSGTEYLWGMALWVGALKDLEPAVTTSAFPLEFRPGTTELDVIYVSQEGQPGGHRYPSPDADDDSDGAIDEDWLDGRDNDMDGAIDEDFAAVSSEMFFCEYNDTDPAIQLANPAHVPLALHVQQQSMVWEAPLRDDVVGLRYHLTNTGFDPLSDVHVGFMADFDIGPRDGSGIASDDRAGFWEGIVTTGTGADTREMKLSIGYMFDADGDVGAAEGYIGLMFLGGGRLRSGQSVEPHASLSNFRMFAGDVQYEMGGEPTNDEQRFHTMAGTGPLPLPPPDPNTGLRPPLLTSRSDDYRVLLSAGPIDVVDPGDSLVFDFALVIGPGFEGMVESAKQAQLIYDGAWFDRDGDPATGDDGREHQVHWYVDEPTPVALADFAAASITAGVRLRWSMSSSALQGAMGIHVQRSESAFGPFVTITPGAMPPMESMTFEDADVEVGRSYWYRLLLLFADGSKESSHAIRVDTEAAGRQNVSRLEVSQDDQDAVRIDYWIAGAPAAVRVRIFDVAGREIRSWDEGTRDVGAHQIDWDGSTRSGQAVAGGIYFVQLQAGNFRTTRKLILVQR